jgi:hypothetical protein
MQGQTWYQLSADQSGRLLGACDGRPCIDSTDDIPDATKDAVQQAIEEIETSLREADIVDQSTLVLRPSFESDDGET